MPLPQHGGPPRRRDPPIKAIFEKYQHSKAVRALENFEDIQSGIINRISEEQMLGMVLEAFCPADEAVQRLSPLVRIQTVASIRHTHQTGQRGDDLRSLSASMSFPRRSKFVGPGRGTSLDYTIAKQGKTNKVGKIEYSAFAPHVNPVLDTIAWQGMAILYRFHLLGERLPNFLEHKKFFNVPVYRSATDATAFLNADTQTKEFKTFYASQGVIVEKVTHQGRIQVQQDMDDNGISTPHIGHFCKYSDG